MTGETEEPTAAPSGCLQNLCCNENTQLFNTSSRKAIIESLGMLWEYPNKVYNPSCEMCIVTFLFITSRAPDTGMLVNSALTSNETMVSSGFMAFPFLHSDSPLLSLTKEKFLPVYFCTILVRNFKFVGRCVTSRYYGSEWAIWFMDFSKSIKSSRGTGVPPQGAVFR